MPQFVRAPYLGYYFIFRALLGGHNYPPPKKTQLYHYTYKRAYLIPIFKFELL